MNVGTLLLIVIKAFIVIKPSSSYPQVAFKINKDVRLVSSVIKTVSVVRLGQCSTKCSQHDQCGSANYDTDSGECELLAMNTSNMGDELVPKAASVHCAVAALVHAWGSGVSKLECC